jgi:hypothetical protein
MASYPTPGLQGTLSGTCIACYKPTDTALGVEGDPEWHAAFLVVLGVPQTEALATIERSQPPRRSVCRVCEACAAKSPFPKPVLALPGVAVPTVGHPE